MSKKLSHINNTLKWCSFFTSVALIGLGYTTIVLADNVLGEKCPSGEKSHPTVNDASSDNHWKHFLLVSTMDGKVSALNVAHGGKVMWEVDTSGPLLSSSITDIELTRDGVPTRLIPSLDGALFQFDGHSIEPLPFTADTLLSSSSKLYDDSMIVGGKESTAYGIDPKTGELRYVCEINGCRHVSNESLAKDVLVVRRNMKTVRSFELKTGYEKWNFSVGQHEVSYLSETRDDLVLEEKKRTGEMAPEICNVLTEESVYTDDDWLDFTAWLEGSQFEESENDLDIRVVVPRGVVEAVRKVDRGHVSWSHMFDSPIAAAWTFKSGVLSEVSLFDDRHVPALSSSASGDVSGSGDDETEIMFSDVGNSAFLYLGVLKNQLYVQPSVRLAQEMELAAAADSQGGTMALAMPRVHWKPYLATAPSRTPAIVHQHNPLQISWDKPPDDLGQVPSEPYPFDNGYYLFADYSPVNLCPLGNKSDIANKIFHLGWNTKNLLITILVLSSVLWFAVGTAHRILSRRRTFRQTLPKTISPRSVDGEFIAQAAQQMESQGSRGSQSEREFQNRGNEHPPLAAPLPMQEYSSRYCEDFHQVACLGKGGYGVVFEVTNKVDDCQYAVKRIPLHNCEKAKEKVMREVKALAKLEHSGIVRYYQAWFECPPAGWQEERDKMIIPSDGTATASQPGTVGFTVHEYTPCEEAPLNLHVSMSRSSEVGVSRKAGSWDMSDLDPAKKWNSLLLNFGGSDLGSPILAAGKKGSSEEFFPHLAGDEFSGDYPDFSRAQIGGVPKNGSGGSNRDDFIEIEFGSPNSNTGETGNLDTSLSRNPFLAYGKRREGRDIEGIDRTSNSVDIVFEDSGCGGGDGGGGSGKEIFVDQYHRHSIIDISVSQSETSGKVATPNGRGSSKEEEKRREREGVVPVRKMYLYIQMQLCRRESLKDWLNENMVDRNPQELLDIFEQITCAVDYVHNSGLMHRDLKPTNIFFAMNGVVKVGDFGLATAQEENDSVLDHLEDESSAFAKHTDRVGTKLYMSPEQAARKSYNWKVDIYALGLIFFELFYPFSTQMERVKTLLEVKKLLFPQRFIRDFPMEHAFVEPLLSHDPDQRPSTKEILLHDLLRPFMDSKEAHNRLRSRTISHSSSNSSNSP